MAFNAGDLFRRADAAMRREAEQAWRHSPAGELFEMVRYAERADPRRLMRSLRAGASLRDLVGTTLWEIGGAIERYAGKPQWRLISEFLRSLGPVGAMIESLFAPIGKQPIQAPLFRRSLQEAVQFIRAFGLEVLPSPRMLGEMSPEDRERAIAAAYEFIRQYEESRRAERREVKTVADIQREMEERAPRVPEGGEVMVPMRFGGPRAFPADHPLVSGDMVDVDSSNVHSIGYDLATHTLYVRFWRKRTRRGVEIAQPGTLYGYRDVWPEQFLEFLKARSKGNWVWDHLRERGTVSGHKKPYFVAGISGGYVPRQAALTIVPMPQLGRVYAEVFRPRVVFHRGKWLESKKPLEVVQVLGVVQPPGPGLRRLTGM